MKKYIAFLLLAAFLLPACNDMLELRDNGTTDMSRVFSDRNMTRGYINACYNYVVGTNLRVGSYTDDAQDAQSITSGSRYDYWYNQTLNASNFGSYNFDGDPWGQLFQGIRKCNVFLDNIGTATAKMTEQERQAWAAQAKTLRALYYMQLVKRYGGVPLVTTDLGTDHDYAQDSRSSASDVIRQILTDCDEAIAIPDSEDYSYVYGKGQWGMMTKAVAQAIRAEAATYAISPLLDDGTFDKQQALTVAADALANLLSHGYALWTKSSATSSAYALYHLTNPNDDRAADKETIYGGYRVDPWNQCGVPIVAGTTTAGSCPTQELVDAYEMANGQPAITGYSDASHLQPIINTASGYDETKPYEGRDPRFYDCIFYNMSKRAGSYVNTYAGGTSGISSTNIRYTCTGYYMRKFAADGSNRNSNQDGYLRLMRLTDVYMNFAEVAYQVAGPYQNVSGVNMSAADAVNAIRERAGMPNLPAGLSASEFEARYRNERRIEYAFEMDRYFSLRRWNQLDKAKQVTGMRIVQEGSKYTYNRFAFDARQTAESKYLLYPINTTELNKMTKLTGNNWQNPGW
ncbi:MAG: RagB/SusD family nutrient uptake outer membrane protein [Bacteroidales bacterium]|nr:RagB/SusD family nutrient uptake outer membrane protein [Bacteroidales bacterium]